MLSSTIRKGQDVQHTIGVQRVCFVMGNSLPLPSFYEDLIR